MKKTYTFWIFVLLTIDSYYGQFILDGQFRPRTEYRHGFGTLIADAIDPGFAISTRVRLNVGYDTEDYQFYLSMQDVMVWGENRQILLEDQNDSFAVFEAWATIHFGKGWSTKLGRQVISYDDQRIFGGLDWAQQGRNHDAAIIKYKKQKFIMDLGLAFSQDFDNPAGFQSMGTAYNTTGFFTYKTMQYLYLRQNWSNFSGSLLLLNNGFQNFTGPEDARVADGTSNLQTCGTHLEYKKESFGAALNAFVQTGERQNSVEVRGAYLIGLDVNHKVFTKLGLGIGAEIITGNKTDTTNKTEAFFPLYGTNHKFNGFMDYFYVGNHANSIGLFDIHVSADITLSRTSNFIIKLLSFSGNQELPSGKKSLGTELDLVYSKKFKGYGLAIGYSQLFAADGMYELKGSIGDMPASRQNWAWIQLTIKPLLYGTKQTD